MALASLRFRAVDYTNFTWARQVKRQQRRFLDFPPKVDLVMGTFGPASPLWLARRFAKALGTPWVADFRDLGSLRADGRGRLSLAIDRRIERRLLASASGITTVSPTLGKILAETYQRPTAIVYNGWDPLGVGETEELTAEESLTTSESPYLLYAGRLYPEQLRGAALVIESLAREPYLRLVVRSLGPPAMEKAIRRHAESAGVADRVELRPPCDPDELSVEAAGATANVVLSDLDCREAWSRGVLTGKFLELVGRRPPVLAVTRADSDMGPILRRTQKGMVCSTSDEVHEFVRTVRQSSSFFQGDRREVERFGKRAQAAALARFLDKLVSAR